jgi:hypothetical protein
MCSHHMVWTNPAACPVGMPWKPDATRPLKGVHAPGAVPSATRRKAAPKSELSISVPIRVRIRFASQLRCRCGGAKNARRTAATPSETMTATANTSRKRATARTSSG